MHSLALRPCLGPAVHYWVRQGNGRLSFCRRCLLEMQNMIPLSPLHLLLLPIQVASLPMHKSLRYEVESLNSPFLIPSPTHPPTTSSGGKKKEKSLPLIQWPVPSLSTVPVCKPLSSPRFSVRLCVDDTRSRPSPGTPHKSQGSQLSQS